MTKYKKPLSKDKDKKGMPADNFTTEDMLKSFEEVEINLDEAIRNNAHKEKLSREYAAKFVANI